VEAEKGTGRRKIGGGRRGCWAHRGKLVILPVYLTLIVGKVDEMAWRAKKFVDDPYNKLLTVNILATVTLYNEFHACFRC
jgi:hypothetical protein